MNQFPALDANNLLDKQTPRLRLTLVEKGVCLYGPDNVALQALAPGNSSSMLPVCPTAEALPPPSCCS